MLFKTLKGIAQACQVSGRLALDSAIVSMHKRTIKDTKRTIMPSELTAKPLKEVLGAKQEVHLKFMTQYWDGPLWLGDYVTQSSALGVLFLPSGDVLEHDRMAGTWSWSSRKIGQLRLVEISQ